MRDSISYGYHLNVCVILISLEGSIEQMASIVNQKLLTIPSNTDVFFKNTIIKLKT